MNYWENKKMEEKTCKTCIDNDFGLCNRLGEWVDDDDTCENYRNEYRQDAMMRTFLARH